ncbi:MAG: SPOR domain-containing protein [Magnetococcales bacterium]|nr:SPOR domain-containing protein [Magnetococcales bacterium]MBF0321548.1 SPOR domain-containing protein [Magnetococcales bacterium]
MKASPNREQQIFLIVGGVIFGLILVVVIYNMIQDPKQTVVEDIRRPLVVAPANRPSEDAKRPWIETVKPAPIFESTQSHAVVPPQPGQVDEQPAGAAAPGEATGAAQAAQAEGGQRSVPIAAAVATAVARKGNKVPPAAVAAKPEGGADPIGTWAAKEQREEVMPEPEEGPPPKAKTNGKQSHNEPATAKPPRGKTEQVAARPSAPPAAPSAAPPEQHAKVSHRPAREANSGDAEDVKGSYSVQLGSFSSADRAAAIQEKVKKVVFEGHPVPVFQKVGTVSGQSHYRVRLGPFATQKQAELAAQLVKRQTGFEGRVLSPGK